MIKVTRKAHFNASHRLHNPEKSDEWNQRVFGKCNNPNWHGHNYLLEVTVAGEPNPETGYVIDLGELKSIIKKRVIDPCDHKNLNLEVPFLDRIIPSTENLCKVFFHEIEDEINQLSINAKLYSVLLHETERNSAEYCPYLSI
ncbi:MAG: 6-carboxytetrahydropterin synthase [Balneolaceae bacterium]|nr:6-carboxytetrahydropterin synthase [Balneolaceae bacterium]